MVSAAAMVVEQRLTAQQVSRELKIPYTTVSDWARKYRLGGAAALEARPGRGGKRRPGPAKPNPRPEAIVAVKRSQPQAGRRRIRARLKPFFRIRPSPTPPR